jgi:ribonuclease-3
MKKPKNLPIKNGKLLITALTHRSALNEKKGAAISNERLEFLGDAVLELVVSNYLYHHYPEKAEGQLTHLRAKIVQTKTLAAAATKLDLGKHLILSKGEKRAGGQRNPSLLADGFEAVIGAVYLDQGLPAVTGFIKKHLLNQLKTILKEAQITDYKSKFQELWQKKAKITPTYKIIRASGPDHHKIFKIKVYLKNKAVGEGTGKSKQAAQQSAARAALEKKKLI